MTYKEGKEKENLESEVGAKFCSSRIFFAGDLRCDIQRNHVNSFFVAEYKFFHFSQTIDSDSARSRHQQFCPIQSTLPLWTPRYHGHPVKLLRTGAEVPAKND